MGCKAPRIRGWVARCPYCDELFPYIDGHVDHIRPHAAGGSNKMNNLVLVCATCNKDKRDIPLELLGYDD